jgi:hypothetical protein
MKSKIFRIIPITAMIGIMAGAIGGFIYYWQVGCVSGTCPLTSNPYLTLLWGAVMGYLIGDMFTKKKPVEKKLYSLDPNHKKFGLESMNKTDVQNKKD